jgi:hypothetical protein
MVSKYIHTGIIARLIASYGIDKVILRVSGNITAIGKTLRAHIIMDRGLGLEVPVYWCKKDDKDNKKRFAKKVVDVKTVVNI